MHRILRKIYRDHARVILIFKNVRNLDFFLTELKKNEKFGYVLIKINRKLRVNLFLSLKADNCGSTFFKYSFLSEFD